MWVVLCSCIISQWFGQAVSRKAKVITAQFDVSCIMLLYNFTMIRQAVSRKAKVITAQFDVSCIVLLYNFTMIRPGSQ